MEDDTVTIGIPTFNRASWLHESISSVLSQSYANFRLLICDNASEDDTQEVVRSFSDPRIDYAQSDHNIGMIGNFNRVIQLAETDFLIILPDDDVLYPDYLSSVVTVLKAYRSAGLVHTAFDRLDGESHVLERNRNLVDVAEPMTLESGKKYLERSMRSGWTVCWSSALFRRKALIDAGGYRASDEPFSDIPLLMRIALDWDFAYLAEPLVGFRTHAEAATAAVGTFNGTGYEFDDLPSALFRKRMDFLSSASLAPPEMESYRAQAMNTFRRESAQRLGDRAGLGAGWMVTTTSFLVFSSLRPENSSRPRPLGGSSPVYSWRTLCTPRSPPCEAARDPGRRAAAALRRAVRNSSVRATDALKSPRHGRAQTELSAKTIVAGELKPRPATGRPARTDYR